MEKERFKDKLKSFFARCGEETPPFFKKLRMVGIVVAAAGTAVITAPVALPAIVTAIGGYLIVGGSVASAVSQAAMENSGDCNPLVENGDEDLFAPVAN